LPSTPHARCAIVARVLLVGAILLAVGGLLVLLTGGMRINVGDLVLSVRDHRRLWLDSSFLLIARELLCCRHLRRRWPAALLVGYFVVALVAESSPRLVGDGVEYVTMARQLSLGRPPGVSPSDAAEAQRALAGVAGAESGLPMRGDLASRDGRRQFEHFWIYSLLAAPFAGVARIVGTHPSYAFTVLNTLLLCGTAWIVASRIGFAAMSLLLLGPAIWWVDKAHTELFTLTLLTAAAAILPTRPRLALPLIGLATAQNPPLVVVLVAAMVWTVLRHRSRPWLAFGVALGIASLHPLYYWWTIGRASPLLGVTLRHWPGATAYLTPLLDLNLGFVWAFVGLALSILLVLPAWLRPRQVARFWLEGALLVTSVLVLLLAFAQTPNVNHGGTPGPSRYTMWLVPFAAPLFRIGALSAARWRERTLAAVAMISLVCAVVFYHPRLPQDCRTHTRLATWLLATWPQLYNPVPEVFVERTLAVDGEFILPAATPRCEKVLLAGGTQGTVAWPIPCGPASVPPPCSDPGVLCYANRSAGGYTFVRAPDQRGLPAPQPAPAWDAVHRAAWDVLGVDWPAARGARPLSSESFVKRAAAIARISTLQTDRDLVAWVRTMGTGSPSLVVEVPGRAEWWLFDAPGPPASLGPPRGTLAPGGTLPLPPDITALLVVRVPGRHGPS